VAVRRISCQCNSSAARGNITVKPLPPILLTKEDHDIWCRVTWDGHLHGWHEFAQDSDRRDAELMLALAAGEMVKVDLDAMTLSFQWSYEGVPKLVVIRGNGSNITNFA
jgi:hypothetical protein